MYFWSNILFFWPFFFILLRLDFSGSSHLKVNWRLFLLRGNRQKPDAAVVKNGHVASSERTTEGKEGKHADTTVVKESKCCFLMLCGYRNKEKRFTSWLSYLPFDWFSWQVFLPPGFGAVSKAFETAFSLAFDSLLSSPSDASGLFFSSSSPFLLFHAEHLGCLKRMLGRLRSYSTWRQMTWRQRGKRGTEMMKDEGKEGQGVGGGREDEVWNEYREEMNGENKKTERRANRKA